jgi:hypothetical protein
VTTSGSCAASTSDAASPIAPYMDDLRAASQSYAEGARELFDQMADGAMEAAEKVRQAFADAFRKL